MPVRKTKEQFIQQSIAVHGNKYGYDSVEYVDGKTRVAILCPEHGVFMQPPEKHLSGRGCRKCEAKSRRISFDEFVRRSNNIHRGKYQYDKESYTSLSSRVRILCSKHGWFSQAASDHINGSGCRRCAVESRSVARRLDPKTFIERSKELHGGKYDYSKAKYTNSTGLVIITCPTHGDFKQAGYKHLQGRGCPICAGTKKSTTEEFISKAIAIHGNCYDYSCAEYEGNKKPVAILCRKHGVFYQRPNDHLFGEGCPVCQESSGERAVRLILERNGVGYEREKRFDDCKSKTTLPFDFYLPELNICIEYQGKQHYEDEPFFDAGGGFEGRQRRDQIKRDYCASHGIKLIEIKYNESVNKKLQDLWNTQKLSKCRTDMSASLQTKAMSS